jgi:hypothetical protein
LLEQVAEGEVAIFRKAELLLVKRAGETAHNSTQLLELQTQVAAVAVAVRTAEHSLAAVAVQVS